MDAAKEAVEVQVLAPVAVVVQAAKVAQDADAAKAVVVAPNK